MTKPKSVLIIDAGIGNVGSVLAAFSRHNCSVHRLSSPPENIDFYTHAVLPGVGAFTAGIEALKDRGWASWLVNVWCQSNRPLLGICLGMQLLATEGEEGQVNGKSLVRGLGLIPGKVLRMSSSNNLVLPHVGWNEMHWYDDLHPLSLGMPDGADMYFVHSYSFRPDESENYLAWSDYGDKFASIVGNGNCLGVQFHPEKSQRLGKKLLGNFLRI